jgi:hypothetical protein
VEFTGLTVTPYVNQSTNRLAYSLKATGVKIAGRAPRSGGQDAAA